MIYLVASFFAVVILFAGFPRALCRANRVHLENGREPNAGIAFMPDLIFVVAVWLIATGILNHFASTEIAWVSLCAVSSVLLVYNLISSGISIRSYRRNHGDDD